MSDLSAERIRAYRARTYRLLPELRLTSAAEAEAVTFVEERGGEDYLGSNPFNPLTNFTLWRFPRLF